MGSIHFHQNFFYICYENIPESKCTPVCNFPHLMKYLNITLHVIPYSFVHEYGLIVSPLLLSGLCLLRNSQHKDNFFCLKGNV